MDLPASSMLCPFCGELMNRKKKKVVEVGKKGLVSLIEKSKSNNDHKWKKWKDLSQMSCHTACRLRYLNARVSKLEQGVRMESIKSGDNTNTISGFNETSFSTEASDSISQTNEFDVPMEFVKSEIDMDTTSDFTDTLFCTQASDSNSETNEFDAKHDCLFCGRSRITTRPHIQRKVTDEAYKVRVMNRAGERQNDELGRQVLERISGITSLLEAEAGYHVKCAREFFRIAPCVHNPSLLTIQNQASFEDVCQYIERSGRFQFTVPELKRVMKDNYMANPTLYRKLMEKYGKDIHIEHGRGNPTVIYYKYFDFGDMCKKFYRGEDLHDLEKQTIFKVTAELLKNDIKKHCYKNESYPPPVEFLKTVHDDIPQSLWNFLGVLLESEHTGDSERFKMKRATAAHMIISSVRSKSFISSLQLAVGTYVYKKTGSKQIIELLERMGVSASYYHLVQFESSAVVNPPEMSIQEGVHVQHVFDNTVHNVSTLGGHQTLHCLGGIAVYTLESHISYDGCIKRVTRNNEATAAAVANKSRIKTVPYSYLNAKGLEAVKYTDSSTLFSATPPRLPAPYSVYLWAKSFGVQKLPSWSGFMEVLSAHNIPLTSRVVCLPFINEAPSQPTTINTALHFALSTVKRLKQKSCFVTFDQPLYQKVRAIVAEAQENGELKNVYVRLDGFHLLMSYLGAIGYIMSGSGIESLWSAGVYAPNSVKMMLNGYAYSRAMRAHILTFTALGIAICRSANNSKIDEYRAFITSFLEKWDADPPQPPTIGDCRDNCVLAEMTEEFVTQIDHLKNNGPTAQLWLQYFELIIIALQFVEAERLGNWELHLQSVRKMLPVFHAAGHLPYAKSAQLYLQDMVQLKTDMEHNEYVAFVEGYSTVRKSDKTWSGVWSDMRSAQTLNRFFGTDLKHGRGATSAVVARYLLAMPTMCSVMASVEEYFQMSTSSSEQRKDLGFSRQKRDDADLETFLSWINKNEPFKRRPTLVSLSTGIVGGPEMNCHLAIEIGEKALLTMVGKNAKDISLSMTNKVKTLESAEAGIRTGTVTHIQVDTAQLFHRISVLFQNDSERKKRAFDYELSPFPLALFDDKGFMRKTPKAELYKTMKPHKPAIGTDQFLREATFVVDGDFLLPCVSWPHGSTYRDLFESYRVHIVSNYGVNAWIVFDGSSNEFIGIKSYERYRCREENCAKSIEISEDMFVTLTQAKCLSNIENKVRFVRLLAAYLKKERLNVKLVEENVEAAIANAAIKLNQVVDGSVAVVGHNSDLFVLLIALADERRPMYFCNSLPSSGKDTLYSTSDHEHLREFILFAHAFLGCNSTSALCGKGKRTIINLLEKNSELRQHCRVFYNAESSKDALLEVAQKVILRLYGFEKDMTLGAARYEKYESSAISNVTEVRLASLPPTTAALLEHTKRVYLQIQTWLGNVLRPEDWGWIKSSTLLLPTMSTENPAPEELLNMVSCGCTTDCATVRCSCKKSGMECSKFCKHCNGVRCKNVPVIRPDFSTEYDVVAELEKFNIAEDNAPEYQHDDTWLENYENDLETNRCEEMLINLPYDQF